MENTIALSPLLRMMRKIQIPRKLGILELLFGSSLAVQGIGWVKCSNGITWKLDLTDPTHRWIVFGVYEGGIGLNYARDVLKQGGVFVDSGSNIGQWILYLGDLPDLEALEFEPVESQRNWLTSCLKRQAGWNCTTFPWGLGSESCEMEIQCDGARSTLRHDWYQHKRLDRETIQIRRLDDILKEAAIDQVQLWKLDVEGAEYDALVGAGDYIKNHRIKHLYFECHPTNYVRNKSYLEASGYQLYDINKTGLQPKLDDEINDTQDLLALPQP